MTHFVSIALTLALGFGASEATAQAGAANLLKLPATPASLTPATRAAIFKAAGAVQRGGKWMICADDPENQGATIEKIADFNGDGRADALLTEGGSYCNGMTGTRFALLSQQADGSWKQIEAESGVAEFKPRKGVAGWPDLEIGGPGFCFPLYRWTPAGYKLHHFNEYSKGNCREQGSSPAVPAS